VWLLNAAIDHLDENIGILVEFNHQLLLILHLSEGVLIHTVGIVEK
jgi:hypothetical protein